MSRRWRGARLALAGEVELLIRIGNTSEGVDTDTDKAIDTYPDICILRQSKRL